MPVNISTDAPAESVAITDGELALVTRLLAADRLILGKVQRIARIGASLYVRGNTNGWWRLNSTGPLWTQVADPTVPVVVPPPVVTPPVFAPPDIMDMDLTGTDAIKAYCDEGNMSGGRYGDWPSYANKYSANYNPLFLTDPANGTHFLRAGGDQVNSFRILNWFINLGQPNTKLAGFAPVEELYLRHCIRLNANVLTGCDPRSLGMKLSGVSGLYPGLWPATIAEVDITHLTGVHSLPMETYAYSQEGAQIMTAIAEDLEIMEWSTIEQRVKMNTPGIADGILEFWHDDKPVYSRTDMNFRGNNGAAKWGCMQAQIYVGGQTYPFLGNVDVDFAHLAMSTQRIGRPHELMAA